MNFPQFLAVFIVCRKFQTIFTIRLSYFPAFWTFFPEVAPVFSNPLNLTFTSAYLRLSGFDKVFLFPNCPCKFLDTPFSLVMWRHLFEWKTEFQRQIINFYTKRDPLKKFCLIGLEHKNLVNKMQRQSELLFPQRQLKCQVKRHLSLHWKSTRWKQ